MDVQFVASVAPIVRDVDVARGRSTRTRSACRWREAKVTIGSPST